MIIRFILLVLTFFFNTALSYYDFSSQYAIQDKQIFSPCSFISHYKSPVSGETIFSQASMTSSQIQELMITGWFIFKGNNQITYPFLIIEDNSIIIFTLNYKISTHTISYSFKANSNSFTLSSLSRNKYFFLKVQLIVGSSDKVNILIFSPNDSQNPIQDSYPSSAGYVTSFKRSSMQISVGQFISANQNPSCALVKQVVIFLNPQPFSDSSASSYHSKLSMDTVLYWHFDTYLSRVNPNKLISQGFQQYEIAGQQFSLPDYRRIYSGNEDKLDLIELEEHGSCIVYFEFRVVSWLFNYISIASILLQDNSNILTLAVNVLGGIQFNNDLTPLIMQMGSWYQAVIIIDLFPKKRAKLIVGKIILGFAEIGLADSTPSLLRLQIGSSGNGRDVEYDNIRIYKGAFVSETSSCLLQISRQQQHCIICQSGYLLSYQDGMKCVGSGSSSDKDNILDWTRSDCSQHMYYSVIDAACVCLKGFYKNGNSCLACPSYCEECSGQQACLVYDSQRDLTTGLCQNSLFDDGFVCQDRSYYIPFRQNLILTLPKIGSSDESSFQIRRTVLNWLDGTSFFISFYISGLDDTISFDYSSILFYLRDSYVDWLHITLNYQASSSSYKVCYYLLVTQLGCFTINPTFTWVGIWSNFTRNILLSGSSGQVLFEDVPSIWSTKFIDPIVCIGTCNLLNPTQTYADYKGQVPGQVLFIQGISYPINRMDDFALLKGHQTNLYYFYDSSHFSTGTPLEAQNIIQTFDVSKTATLQFFNSQIDPIKGFLIQSGTVANLADINFGVELSISAIIFFQKIESHATFFKFTMDGMNIAYSFIQIESQKISVKICIDLSCKISNKFPFKTASAFLAIIQRDLDLGSTEATFFEFEIVLDYRRDQLRFHFPVPHSANRYKSNIQILGSDSLFYMNNIRFFLDCDFYFDYSLPDPCFLYYNLEDMQCFKAKIGYAVYNGKAVESSKCSTLSNSLISVSYNSYTQECVGVVSPIENCTSYDETTGQCSACIGQHFILPGCTDCEVGYYKSEVDSTCQQCHPKCSSCSSYEDCTACKYTGTQIPECNCVSSNMYLDSTYQCKNCSSQCDGCSGDPDTCTNCSEGRVSAPDCSCDPEYYDLTTSNYQTCTLLVCSSKCKTCSSSGCTECSDGRENPPICTCSSNTHEVNSACVSCPLHYYYDSISSSCEKCESHCDECVGTNVNCTQCAGDLRLVGSECVCPDNGTYFIAPSGEVICIEGMDVSLSVILEKQTYWLVFQFQNQLDDIDFTLYPIDTLIYLYIQQIPSETYKISSSTVEGSKLILGLTFTQSFSASGGQAMFLQNNQFLSTSSQTMLNRKYLTMPLPFTIGPLIVQDSLFKQELSLDGLSSALKNTDSSILTTIRQFQVVFFFLNTLQPCVVFLMVKIVIPPNLYQYLQVIGLLIFPTVADYSVKLNKTDYDLLGIPLELNTEVSPNNSEIFRRFGLSNSVLVNMPLTVIQSLAWPILLLIIHALSSVTLSSKSLNFSSKIAAFIIKQIIGNTEVALLIVSTGTFNQFFNLDNDQYLNRMGVYLSIGIILVLLYFNIYNYSNLFENKTIQQANSVQQENVFLILIEKLDFKNRPAVIRQYFFFQIFKKYFVSAMIVFIESFPTVVCTACSILFFSSMVVTGWVRPYKSHWGNISKTGGEACLTSAWLIYLIKFIPFQRHFKEASTISAEQITEFLWDGILVLAILSIFNILFLMDFVWESIILKVADLFKKKIEKEQTVMKIETLNLDNRGSGSYLKYNQSFLRKQNRDSQIKKQLEQKRNRQQVDNL